MTLLLIDNLTRLIQPQTTIFKYLQRAYNILKITFFTFQIQAYYKFRLSHKEYSHDLTPCAIRAAFDHSIISILAPRDQHGRRIMLIESGGKINRKQKQKQLLTFEVVLRDCMQPEFFIVSLLMSLRDKKNCIALYQKRH